ncbi:uncharacterized protein GGS25DRAFT_472318 [Hypoxylon fragiforme]|uniref:uncharacterized protein n=1 Tax=Hypoxylon fragiforme TaxID=63214 RepID=UPI0020C657FC|nr:uncharacterized protein GGS25DRAFT_472318 [Hypoxylon fragiforme]KAI2614572.1 hypothetical protein GGS25DRAFT_472318 [Hypoxylon fragiforme]
MKDLLYLIPLLAILTSSVVALNFTVAGGQIFTPGFAVLDAPQPGTPLGGDTIEVALDVTANGKLRLPPYGNDSPSRINNITIFLYSYVTGRNFTITNGTESANDATLGDIMQSESGSTVKHVKWTWPQCLIGDGKPTTTDSDRGAYNISIRQNFRLNGEDHYTIFDVPISVTNKIEFTGGNPSCDSVNNPLLSPEEIDAESANSVGVLFAPGDSTVIQQPASTSSTGSDGGGSGIGPDKPEANPSDGLGSGASMVRWTSTARRLSVLSIVYFLFL